MKGKTTLPLCFLCAAITTVGQSRTATSLISVDRQLGFFFYEQIKKMLIFWKTNHNFLEIWTVPWNYRGNFLENLTGYRSLPFATPVVSCTAVNDLLLPWCVDIKSHNPRYGFYPIKCTKAQSIRDPCTSTKRAQRMFCPARNSSSTIFFSKCLFAVCCKLCRQTWLQV